MPATLFTFFFSIFFTGVQHPQLSCRYLQVRFHGKSVNPCLLSCTGLPLTWTGKVNPHPQNLLETPARAHLSDGSPSKKVELYTSAQTCQQDPISLHWTNSSAAVSKGPCDPGYCSHCCSVQIGGHLGNGKSGAKHAGSFKESIRSELTKAIWSTLYSRVEIAWR